MGIRCPSNFWIFVYNFFSELSDDISDNSYYLIFSPQVVETIAQKVREIIDSNEKRHARQLEKEREVRTVGSERFDSFNRFSIGLSILYMRVSLRPHAL